MKSVSQSLQQSCNLFNKLSTSMLFVMFLLKVSSEVSGSRFLVKTLPGFDGDLTLTLETGYIGVGASDAVQLFYYFVESQGDPQSDPIMLMPTGGPGCSGLVNLMSKSGPININYLNSTWEKQTLEINSDSWTKVASIIYLDLPAGCGFSYAKTPEAYITNDTFSATHAYQFLRKWLVDHPKFLNNPLYVASSSYSGIPVPIIVHKIYKGNEVGEMPKINIKGYLLGNPLTDINGDYNSKIPYAYRMALLSDAIYKSTQENCHGEYFNVDPNNTLCMHYLQVVHKCLERINTEHILEPQCDIANTLNSNLYRRGLRSFEKSYRDIWTLPQAHIQPCELAQENIRRYIPAWANRNDVRKALHVSEELDDIEWVRCNERMKFDFHKTEDIPYNHNVQSSVAYHRLLTTRNCRALVYSGDHDLLVPYLGTLKWIESLNLLVTDDWRPWFFDEQIVGYTMTYSNHNYNLTFTTIKGEGHTPQEYKPKEHLSMIRKWLANDVL
ncbi:unnamed protein product [Lactuca virosa]|uniref:Uncharacterized protein n=1 Tax=Lactuca virosa TaxID=75947 RepID=A0AAU9NBR3_9ASTR|nr:unnamed protein product [Lactuca virosa]